ncbi:unnamed protein product, partial [Meganyctiphanes norvegica]
YECSGLSGEVDLRELELPRDMESLTISDSTELILNFATLTAFHELVDLMIQDSQVTELKINGSVPVQLKVLKFVRSWSRCPEPVSLFSVGCATKLLDLNSKVF